MTMEILLDRYRIESKGTTDAITPGYSKLLLWRRNRWVVWRTRPVNDQGQEPISESLTSWSVSVGAGGAP